MSEKEKISLHIDFLLFCDNIPLAMRHQRYNEVIKPVEVCIYQQLFHTLYTFFVARSRCFNCKSCKPLPIGSSLAMKRMSSSSCKAQSTRRQIPILTVNYNKVKNKLATSAPYFKSPADKKIKDVRKQHKDKKF